LFFGLQYISDHPCCRMQDAIETFFRESIHNTAYGMHLFPVWYRDSLNNSPKLNDEFESVFIDLQTEDQNARQRIYDQVRNNNNIEEICIDINFQIDETINWGNPIGINIKNLLNRLYTALDHAVFKPPGCVLKPKKSYYNKFIEVNKYVCPFCGLDKYPNRRGKARSDFDHYIDKGSYPLTSANTKNLIPMCDLCNQDYKGTKDIITNNGYRTIAFYPYGDISTIDFRINCINEPVDIDDKGKWEVFLQSDDANTNQKIENWNRVFEIKKRIIEEIEEFYEDWMEKFYEDCFTEKLNSIDELKNLLLEYSEKFIPRIKRKMEAGVIIHQAFYNFMAEDASDLFVSSYLDFFNNMYEQAV
jgi:hypothetical protein